MVTKLVILTNIKYIYKKNSKLSDYCFGFVSGRAESNPDVM